MIDQLNEECERYANHARRVGGREIQDAHRLSFCDVSYRYPGSEKQVLESVTFEVKRGEVVGIVGPSGAGKSTIADLLVGLRTPTSGRVQVDDLNLAEISSSSKARMIALVSQSVPILPGTVAENVKFFRHVNDEAVVAALAQVGLASLVDEMPHGIETVIGTGARAVSGGQAQRIGIARVLARGTELIVLDEPTSALDPESEETIAGLVGALKNRAGIIIIAHRLSTLRTCDRVLVLEGGGITGDGSLSSPRKSNSYVRRAFELGSLDWSSPTTSSGSNLEHEDR